MTGSSEQRRGPTASSAAGDPFFGGGDAGEILRRVDWAGTSLGPVAGWPQSFRTALAICLASRHPICIIWGPDRLYFYNDAYRPILGHKHPWALGRSYIEVWPEIWDSAIRPILEQVESTGEASWCDDLLLVLRRHGFNEECYFQFSFAPTRIEDGSVGGVFTAITETTANVVGERRLRTLRDLGARTAESKSAEEACQLAAATLAENPHDVPFALFYLVDDDGTTARLVTQTGIEAGTAASPRRVSLTQEDSADIWQLRSAIQTGQRLAHATVAERSGALPGGPWPEPTDTVVVLPISRPGSATPYGFLVSGVSPRRRLDPDYESFLGLVASQMATAMANALALAEARHRADTLTALDRAKTDFFSNVSHEFRTPLTLILGPLEEVLGNRHPESVPAAVREQLKIVHRNSLRLLKLVNTLLDFARIEAGRMDANFEPVDLPAFTAELVGMFRGAIEKAGLKLIVSCEPTADLAYIDRDMWEKIVFNLVSNATKFTLHGEIEVALRQVEDRFELRVRDTGIGIAAEHQSAVFQRFYRLKPELGRTYEGTGIGLSFVLELVRLHRGRVNLSSEVNVGTIVTVEIPAGNRHLPAQSPARTQSRAHAIPAEAYVEESLRWIPTETGSTAQGLLESGSLHPFGPGHLATRVLVADDNADMRDYITRLLKDRYDVSAVPDGNTALTLVRQWQPELVIADVMMPGLDGFRLIEEMRKDPVTRMIPVILVSARAGEGARIEGLEAGADDYLTKPFGARELLVRVQSHLRLAELRRSAEAKIVASEMRLEQLVTMLPAGIFAVDAAGRVTFFNPRAAEIWQATPRLRESYDEFAAMFRVLDGNGDPVPTPERPVAVVLREGRAIRSEELTLQRPNGSRFHASVSISPTFGPDGRVNGAITVFQDVTADRDARAALRATEERFRAVFQQAAIGMFECDLAGRILRSNPAFSRMLGYTEAELQALNWRDLVIPDPGPEAAARAAEVRGADLTTFNGEHRLRCKDGSALWLDVFATTVRAASGQPGYGLVILVDITERKRTAAKLLETEARFRLAADSAPVLIWITDTRRERVWFNKPWLDFVGRSLEEERGTGWMEHIHPDDKERLIRVLHESFDARSAFSIEYRLRRHDGDYRWMLAHGVPRRQDGEYSGHIGSCVDITDRRLAEEAMHASQAAESARRRELEIARDEAVAASRAKDDFLAALSHELRTPLNPVLLLASEAASDSELPASVRADFETIRKSIELEARLIDDLLDLTRIVRDKIALDLREVDVPLVLRDSLVAVRADLQAKEIGLIVDLAPEPQIVRADPARLQQVFWNVLKNAVKFTPHGGRVTITTRIDAPTGHVAVEIADTGIGMTPAEIERVFDAFSQGDHASGGGSHRFGGLGLGLAISQRIVALHEGRISAFSQGRNLGALFRIELPLAHPRAADEATAAVMPVLAPLPREEASPAPRKGRVLIVEDHGPTRLALQSLLTRRHYDVTVAATVAEARRAAQHASFDLLVSDIGLPDGSGYELMREFGERYGFKGIALTGYGMEDDVARSRSAGFASHLTKPVRIQDLDRALAELEPLKP